MRRLKARYCCGISLLAFFCSANGLLGFGQTGQPDSAQKMFEFHSGFWTNLHHFLYREAESSEPQKGPHPSTLNQADAEELRRLSPAERTVWNGAVAYYKDHLSSRDLLFDRGMEDIKNRLEDAELSPDLANVQIEDDLKGLLLRAAPIYREHWWPRHATEDRQWIDKLMILVKKYGQSISDALVRIYAEPWPGEPVRVDAVVYANWAGAYTTLEPTRPTISTTDSSNQGFSALEIVFHETSHGMIGNVMRSISEAENAVNARDAKQQVRFRRDLWHEVLFYTSGELVAEHVPGYRPFADENGLWTRAWSDLDRSLIEQDWKPHMTGSVPLSTSLGRLVRDLAIASTVR
ncbi:MAG TPA: hypothetical protein VI488_20055 [Candidatus Angelobacter sp.]